MGRVTPSEPLRTAGPAPGRGGTALRIPVEINYTSGVPIYVQIKDGLKQAILTGSYPLGARLPTVRQLAVDLKINANTVNRAYAELEREGVLSSQQGRGTFVTLETGLDSRQFQALQERLRGAVTGALADGFGPEEIQAAVSSILQDRPQQKGKP